MHTYIYNYLDDAHESLFHRKHPLGKHRDLVRATGKSVTRLKQIYKKKNPKTLSKHQTPRLDACYGPVGHVPACIRVKRDLK